MRAALREQRARLDRRGEIGHALHVDVDGIEKAPIGRVVGARAFPIVGKERVQRIDADDAAAGARGRRGDLGERREVADALIAASLERIEMRREAEAARAVAKLGRKETPVRRLSSARPPPRLAGTRCAGYRRRSVEAPAARASR